jgi:hypothetical protein
VEGAPRPEKEPAAGLFPEKRLFDCVAEAPRPPLPPKRELPLDAIVGILVEKAASGTVKAA